MHIKYRIYFYLFFLGITMVVYPLLAQVPGGFNNTYFLDTTNIRQLHAMAETENGYISIGRQYVQGNNDYKFCIMEIDRAGQILWNRSYESDSLLIFPSHCRLYRTNDTTYEWFCYAQDTTDMGIMTYPAVMRFNDSGYINYLKILYPPDTCSYHQPYISLRTSDGGYLLALSNTVRPDMIMKINKDYELEWSKYLNLQNAPSFIESMEELSDGSYIISIWQVEETRVVMLSNTGALKWWKKTGGLLNDDECYAIEGYDSSILMVNIFTTEDFYSWNEPVKMKFEATLFDFNGEVIWNKLFNEIYYRVRLGKLLRDYDSTFVFYGNESSENSFMFRINSNGDSLVSRKFDVIPDDYNNSSYIMDGLLSNVGATIYCGDGSFGVNNIYYAQQPWIVKLDWYGCFEAGCDSTAVYVSEINTSADTICLGTACSVSVLASGPQLVFQWQSFDSDSWSNLDSNQYFTGVHDDTLYINENYPDTNLKLRCIVTNSWWQKVSHEINIHYKVSPTILENISSVVANVSDDIQFSINANGNEPLYYEWFFDESPIEGDSNVLLIRNVSSFNTGFYFCRIYNSCGEVYSDTVRLDILSIPHLEDDTKFLVYPNPNNGNFNLHFPSSVKSEDAEAFIYDNLGLVGYQHIKISEKVKLKEQELTPGRYFIRIITRNQVYEANVIVLQ